MWVGGGRREVVRSGNEMRTTERIEPISEAALSTTADDVVWLFLDSGRWGTLSSRRRHVVESGERA